MNIGIDFKNKNQSIKYLRETFKSYPCFKLSLNYRHIIFKIMIILGVGCAYASTEDLDLLQNNAQKDVWILSKSDSRHNVKTWYKQETGKHTRTFKVEAMMDVPMEKAAMALVGGDSWKRWFWECLDSKLLNKVSSRESIFYLKVNVPRPFPDRDTVLRATIEPYSKKTGKLVINFNALPDYLAPVDGVVRAKAFSFKVEITPLTDSSVKVDLEGYVDPGKDLPAWAVNFMMRSAPYSSALGLERYVKTHGLDATSSFDFRE